MKTWSPEKPPAGDRLLLLLGSKGLWSDQAADAALDASIGCSLLPNASDASTQLALEVCATDMILRVYLDVRSASVQHQ